jgi:hypothetical protein
MLVCWHHIAFSGRTVLRIALFLVAALALLLDCGQSASIAGTAVPTQREWMVGLVDGMGWSFGLPDQPEDTDYLAILEGGRRFRIEAELRKQPTDMVSVKQYTSFGPFSGEGWVSGIASPTVAHLRFLLPLSGSYRLSAALRLAGHEIRIGEQSFRADGENAFVRVPLGEAELPAGELEFTVHIPPNGAIDYIELEAPSLLSVRPLSGWEPDRPLSRDDLAVTAARLLDLEPLLPPSGVIARVEAESAAELKGAAITDIRHLGQPSGGRWIRAGAGGGRVRLFFTPPAASVYRLLLRGEASSPLTATLNEDRALAGEFPSYLQSRPMGTFFLEARENILDLRLPPRGGIDSLVLEGRRSEGADYRRLVGLPAGEEPPSLAEMDALLALLAGIGSSR